MSQQEWPKADSEMDGLVGPIQKNAESGNEQTTLLVKDFEKKVQQVKSRKDAAAALMLAEEMRRAIAALIPREEILKGFVAYCYHSFDEVTWRDAGKARMAVDAAAQLLMQPNASLDLLESHCNAIDALMDRSRTGGQVVESLQSDPHAVC